MNKIIPVSITLIFFILGLVYILAPAPQHINDIPPLSGSLKSTEPGDTIQNPNISAYFSDYWREDVTKFYLKEFEKLNAFGFIIPAIRLNHPPEEAFQFVRDQQKATYLEQYIFPLRGSLFVNGYEPISPLGKRFDSSSVPINQNGQFFNSKTTLRFYPIPLFTRIIFYLGIWMAIIGLYLVTKRIVEDLRR